MSSFLSQHANCRIRTCGISEIYDRLASGWFQLLTQVGIWSIHPGLNQGSRCCRPVPYLLAMDACFINRNAAAVPKGVEPSSSGRQPDIMNRYTMEPDGRNYWLRSSVSALSAQRSAIELSSCMVGRAGFEPANPEEADLQSAAFSHLRYLPKWRRAQDSNLQACQPSSNCDSASCSCLFACMNCALNAGEPCNAFLITSSRARRSLTCFSGSSRYFLNFAIFFLSISSLHAYIC